MMKKLKQRKEFENNWVKLFVDTVERKDGSVADYAFIDRGDMRAPLIVPMTDDGKLVILKEWRYPIKDWTWNFPHGYRNDDESTIDAGKRELKEEAGIFAKEVIELGKLTIDPGINSASTPILLARGLEFGETSQDQGELIEVHTFPIEKIEQMIVDGEIKNGWTIAVLTKLRLFLERE